MGRPWRWFPVFVALATACATAPEVDESAGTDGAERPNVLLILIDDLGFEGSVLTGARRTRLRTLTALPRTGSASPTRTPRRCARRRG